MTIDELRAKAFPLWSKDGEIMAITLADAEAALSECEREKQDLEQEPMRVIMGCRHSKQRMIVWIDNGACPICLSATVGMQKDKIAALTEAGEGVERDSINFPRIPKVAAGLSESLSPNREASALTEAGEQEGEKNA